MQWAGGTLLFLQSAERRFNQLSCSESVGHSGGVPQPYFLNDSCSQPLILFGTLSLLLVFFWSHTSAFFGPLNNAKLLGETLTCMLWHVRLATVLATGPHVTLCARHARVLHMYIEKEYMKVMRKTVSGGGSRYFEGSRYFMTPGPKLVHAIQHQIFKEKKKKFARPTNSRQWLPGNLEFFWSRLSKLLFPGYFVNSLEPGINRDFPE